MTLRFRARSCLLAIGLAHAWLVWSGDILVTYALLGLLMLLSVAKRACCACQPACSHKAAASRLSSSQPRARVRAIFIA